MAFPKPQPKPYWTFLDYLSETLPILQKKEWSNMQPELCMKFVDAHPKCVVDVQLAKGQSTKY